MKYILIIICLAAVVPTRAEVYLDGAAVFSKLSAPAINGRDRANGATLEAGWKFGESGRHAITLGLQAVQWSGARQDYQALSGTTVDSHSVRTRLETFLVGYAWETPLAPAWRLRVTAAGGLGRIKDTTESTLTVSGVAPVVERFDRTESAKFCGRLGLDVRWYFSTHAHLLLGVDVMRKAADDEPSLYYGSFGAVTATTGKIGIGFRF